MALQTGLSYMYEGLIAVGSPSAMSPSFGTAYQSPDPTKAALISVMVETTYTITVANTQVDEVELRVGPDGTVANGSGGSPVATFKSSLTGIAVTVGMGTITRQQMIGFIPINWYFAIRRITGSVAIIQSVSWQSAS